MKSYLIHFIRHGAIDETLLGKYIGLQTNLTNIQRVVYSLAYCFSVASSNDSTVMNVIATNGGKATVTVEQTTKAAIKAESEEV